jgi:hypothetical protein
MSLSLLELDLVESVKRNTLNSAVEDGLLESESSELAIELSEIEEFALAGLTRYPTPEADPPKSFKYTDWDV